MGTGSALFDFLISIVGLCIVVYLIFKALDFIAPDERFKEIARYAVGGAALLIFLVALKGVFFGGGGGTGIGATPAGVIEFAVGLIVALVVLYLVYMVIDILAPEPLKVPVKYVIGAIALIAILILAERVLMGGGMGVLPSNFQSKLSR